MGDAIGEQRLNQALPLMVVGDHGRMPGIGRIDERGYAVRRAIIAQHHGPEIEPHAVRCCEDRFQLAVDFDLLLGEFEVPRVEFRAFLHQRRRKGHGPKDRHAQDTQIRCPRSWLFCHRSPSRLNAKT